MAHLRRSLGFAPGAYPRAYPYVERFVGPDRHANDPWRKALYLAAGLFALHPEHRAGDTLASALGHLARVRESASIEQRFIALLGADPEGLPNLLRQAVSLLAADDRPAITSTCSTIWVSGSDPSTAMGGIGYASVGHATSTAPMTPYGDTGASDPSNLDTTQLTD